MDLDLYQQFLATEPLFGPTVLPPVNLLEYALELQMRVGRAVSRQLGLQEKDYVMYGPDEFEEDKRIHLCYLMHACQALARFCAASTVSLRECETYRCANFVQKKYITFNLTEQDASHLHFSFSPEQRVWYVGARPLLGHSNIMAHHILWQVRDPAEAGLASHNLELLWTCIYECIETLGFQMEACLEQSSKGQFIEKNHYHEW